MNTKTLLLSIVSLSTLSLFSFTKNIEAIGDFNRVDALHAAGAIAGRTGAPGEFNCTQCHNDAAAISNSSVISLNFSGANEKYIPGSTYTLTVDLPAATSPKNGFEIVALRNSDNANIGAFTITDAINTQLKNGGLSRSYVTHTTTGNSVTTWSFDWVAPTNPEGDITFYLAVNQSNNNGITSGDEIHLQELVIEEDASSSVIEQNLIVDIDNSLRIINEYNELKTSLEVEEPNQISMQLMTLNGKVVYFNSASLIKGINYLEPIEVGQYAKGIYIISYHIDDHIISRKIML